MLLWVFAIVVTAWACMGIVIYLNFLKKIKQANQNHDAIMQQIKTQYEANMRQKKQIETLDTPRTIKRKNNGRH